ncbi:hypothetical protein [Iningainema tapete]|uniref:Uncharacterized protein n=2 Tax=Iningainema TaxID=1932705 RepID=A0A8J7CCU5_9CYAN|nr:hypothetical protein [Iningainema tapete]MBD2772455.1 hypothetical protein [Iningainema tapete BLCC-T55]
MHHLNLKSLAFYGVAIGSVLLLFKVVTVYGETKLKAPSQIEENYRLSFQKNLPICEKSDVLMLKIQQSGIYLNGFLLPADATTELFTSTTSNPTLTGRLSNQQLNLSGKVSRTILCNIIGSQTPTNINSFDSVSMLVQLVDQKSLNGQMNINGTDTIEFTAIPQKSQEQSEKLNSH